MKPTNKELQSHKRFLRRQKVYESKYQRRFLAYLNAVNRSVAKWIEDNGVNAQPSQFISIDKLESIYKSLYLDVSINEGKIQAEEFGDNIKTKDLIDDLAGILRFGEPQQISLWRALLKEFIQVRIAARITEVANTTRKRIAILIQRGIEQGMGGREVAKTIREDTGFNKNRSLAIARTETITAANQGKYLAAISSPYVKTKKWLPTNDEHTRPSHLDMLDTPFIDMDALFHVANAEGFLESGQYPCDGTFSASNVINCRCTVVFKNNLGPDGDVIRK